MIMQINVQNSDAVSPVVGVMLMLVVTIIIAAVVSAFAGGLGQGSSKAPQISIGAEAHNDANIVIDFKGGDTISAGAITVKTFIPMGDYKDMSYKVNLTKAVYLTTNENVGECTSYGCTWKTIQPGDKIRIDWASAFAESSYYPGTYFAPEIGEPVNIEIYDSASGKVIATAQTNILPS
jgi:archaeal type IV pilus assembly protein PilA